MAVSVYFAALAMAQFSCFKQSLPFLTTSNFNLCESIFCCFSLRLMQHHINIYLNLKFIELCFFILWKTAYSITPELSAKGNSRAEMYYLIKMLIFLLLWLIFLQLHHKYLGFVQTWFELIIWSHNFFGLLILTADHWFTVLYPTCFCPKGWLW